MSKGENKLSNRGKAVIDAARNCDAKTLEKYVKAGYPVNEQDHNGMTALHYAAVYRARPCLRVLLNSGKCDFLLKNNNGNHASDLAALWAKDYAVCRLLNKKQAIQAFKESSEGKMETVAATIAVKMIYFPSP